MKLNPLIYLIITAVVLGGLFFIFKSSFFSTNPTPSPITTSSNTNVKPEPKIFELTIENKKITNGPEIIKVNQGDEVILKIISDQDEEFHLHGYDKSIDLLEGSASELKFTANLTGRFSYELEKSKTELGALEVSPK